VPNGPTVEVLFGGDVGGPDVGVVRVEVAPGGGMPEHDHGGSDVVVIPLEGSVEITKGGETVAAGVGDAVLVRKDERVALRNPADGPAHLVVAAAPVAFVASVLAWPEG
jgi:quercetin dioxygenase-like cupin family protein